MSKHHDHPDHKIHDTSNVFLILSYLFCAAAVGFGIARLVALYLYP